MHAYSDLEHITKYREKTIETRGRNESTCGQLLNVTWILVVKPVLRGHIWDKEKVAL